MARTTTAKTEEVKAEEVKKEIKEPKKVVDTEKEDMLKMIETLQAQIQLLSQQNNNNGTVILKQNEDLTRTVKVTCLLNNVYNLSTKPYGNGKVFTFKKFGETKNVKFVDMQEILELYRKDFEIGRVVLGSKKDYEDLQIGYVYDDVFSTKEMDELLCLKDEDSVDAILQMDEDMQDNVASLIAKKIVEEGYSYDYNKIKKLEDADIRVSEFEKMLQQEK